MAKRQKKFTFFPSSNYSNSKFKFLEHKMSLMEWKIFRISNWKKYFYSVILRRLFHEKYEQHSMKVK